MNRLNHLKEKFLNIKVTRSWVYLAYLYLLLPALLWTLAWATQSRSFAALFHSYGIFAVSPIPNFSSFTGIVGLALAGWFLFSAARRKDWLDLAVSAGLAALNAAYFLLGWNYLLMRYLTIQ